MSDRETMRAQLIAQHPVIHETIDGEERALSQGEYDATIDRWTDAALKNEQRIQQRSDEQAVRRQVHIALTTLDQDIERLGDGQAMTVAQLRPIVLRIARIERGLIQTLIDLSLIERDG